jgi:plasmid stabilization system protein ParE
LRFPRRRTTRGASVIEPKEVAMPRGDKSAYTDKQKRKAEHIEEGYEKRGVSKKTAAKRAWATVNKQSGGGKKSGSGRKSASKKKSASKNTAKKSATRKKSATKKSARKR